MKKLTKFLKNWGIFILGISFLLIAVFVIDERIQIGQPLTDSQKLSLAFAIPGIIITYYDIYKHREKLEP